MTIISYRSLAFLTVSGAGNLLQLFDVNAWSFHEYLYKTFGSVVKVHSLFSVSTKSSESISAAIGADDFFS